MYRNDFWCIWMNFVNFWKIMIFMIFAGCRSGMMITNEDFHDYWMCSPGGECFASPYSTRGSAQILSKGKRSTLLCVWADLWDIQDSNGWVWSDHVFSIFNIIKQHDIRTESKLLFQFISRIIYFSIGIT